MKFVETKLPGVAIVQPEMITDFRGYFARVWCSEEFRGQGMTDVIAQASIAYNKKKGTIRGMHFQSAPQRESRLMRCTRGSVCAVVIDLRPKQPTFLHHDVFMLDTFNHHSVYVPAGRALGYQTLQDDTEVMYHMNEPYVPSAAAGFRWNDPAFSIDWQIESPILLERDADYPDFDEELVRGFEDYP